jgi:hypothetical protein
VGGHPAHLAYPLPCVNNHFPTDFCFALISGWAGLTPHHGSLEGYRRTHYPSEYGITISIKLKTKKGKKPVGEAKVIELNQ